MGAAAVFGSMDLHLVAKPTGHKVCQCFALHDFIVRN